MKTEIDIQYVARLARLSLTPEEEQRFAAQLEQVLAYIEKLKEVDVSGVEPTAHAFPLVNVTRPDEVRPSLSNEEALRMNGEFAAGPGGEHHQAHDAFAVHLFTIFLDENLAIKAIGGLDEQSGGTGVNAEFVRDLKMFRHD